MMLKTRNPVTWSWRNFVAASNRWSAAMSQPSWLVGGVLPGIERQPCKKLEPSAEGLLGLLHRWRDEAVRAGRTITRIALDFEAGRDGFWLALARGARGRGARDPSLECRRYHGQ